MQTFTIHFEYSRDGKRWSATTLMVKATSDHGAIAQVESKYPYVRNIQIRNIR